MDLSVIIPAYNEEKRLPKTLDDIDKFLKTYKKEVEVLVIDDGSTDDTVTVVKQIAKARKYLRVIEQTENQGKGATVKRGMLEANGDWRLFMDADNATPISEIEILWPYTKDYEVIIGSRHTKGSNIVIKQPWYRILLSRAGNLLIQLTILRGIDDTQAGFKLFSAKATKEIFTRQQITRWGFDMEVLSIAQKVLKYEIKEVPISWYDSGTSRLRPIKAAIRTLSELAKIMWNLATGVYK